MRVSDADRSQITDILSRHYADGRLDQAELNDRVERAMKAKTRADFRGLLDDLPDLDDHGNQPGEPGTAMPAAVRPRRHRPGLHRVIALAIAVAIAVFVAHSLAHNVVLWLLAGLLVVLILREGPGWRRRL